MKPIAALWRLALVGVVGGVLLILVSNAITQPIESKVDSYTAEFTDVSGMHTGADVRVRGIKVGKVNAIDCVGDPSKASPRSPSRSTRATASARTPDWPSSIRRSPAYGTSTW